VSQNSIGPVKLFELVSCDVVQVCLSFPLPVATTLPHSPADARLVGAKHAGNTTSGQLQPRIALTGKPSHTTWVVDLTGC